MRRDNAFDPDVRAYLDAIDASLAGDPVDPAFAEIAELSLLLADERPRPSASYRAALDERVARRFVAPPSVATARRARWRWSPGVLGSVAAVGIAAVVAVVALTSGPASAPKPTAAPRSAASAAASSSSARSPRNLGAPAPSRSGAVSSAASQAAATGSLHLPGNGRKVVQSAELDLSAPPARIESVAQEILDAVANANGIVDHSNVTQGAYGEANFSLRIPSASLSQTLNQLSSLAGARVLSRSDDSQDINGQYVSTRRALADAQALRAALLRQLAAAVTQAQIDSLKTRIHDAENAIAADQAALSSLNSRIDFSRVTVTVVPRSAPAPVSHGGGGFTLGHASHVAGRVLVVAAGVSLIGLAALVPVGLLATLLVWIGSAVRRRRREHALT